MTAILDINEKTLRSYKTVENLEAGLKKFGLSDFRYLIVCNSAGRYTAIFPASELEKNGISYMGYFCQFGFITLG